MTQDQQTTRQDTKPKSKFLFAAMMGVAAAAASFALGIISTIPGVKWLSAVSFSGSHGMDWRLGLLNTYAAMHVKLVGSGMIDSGLGAEKVSASILMPPGLLTVGIGVVLVVGAVFLGRLRTTSPRQRLLFFLTAMVAFAAITLAATPFVHATLDRVALPSTDELSFTPPSVLYTPLFTVTGLSAWVFPAVILFLIAQLSSTKGIRRTAEPATRVNRIWGAPPLLPVFRVMLYVYTAAFLILAVGTGVSLGLGSSGMPSSDADPHGHRITSAIVPAATAGLLILSEVEVTASAEGVHVPTGEENSILDASGSVLTGTRVWTNNYSDKRLTPAPRWLSILAMLATGIVYFIIGVSAAGTAKEARAISVAADAFLLSMVFVGVAGGAFETQLVRIDSEVAKSVVTLGPGSHGLLVFQLLVTVSCYLGAFAAALLRNRKQSA